MRVHPHFWLLAVLLVSSGLARADLAWTNVGPGGGGWIQSLTADPRDPNTVYLGCDVGGFYRSRDGGATWSIHNTGLDDYFVQCIAVHPRDSHIILLGMEGGVFKSTDGGDTWKAARQGFPPPQRYSFAAPIGALAFDPVHPNVVYAGIGRPRVGKDGKGQIYKSTDTGASWTLCTPAGMLDAAAVVSGLAVAPDSSYILAATDKGFYRSQDGGATWAAANGGLPHFDAVQVAIAPSQPQTVYCTLRTTARDDRAWNGGVFRSEDGGRTWENHSHGLATRVGKTGEPAGMTSSYGEITIDPRDPATVYVGDRSWVSAGLYKTTNGGRDWARCTEHTGDKKNMDYGWITQWGPSAESLALSPAAPERLWFGSSGHVFATANGGRSWEQRYCRMNADGSWSGNGLEVTCLNQVIPDPHRPNRVFFAYFDIGLLVSDNGAKSLRDANQGMKYRGNCFTVAFDPTNPQTLWAGTGEWATNHGDVCRSADGGLTWTPAGTPATGLPDGQVRAIMVDPLSPPGKRILYVTSNGNGVYTSADGGATWQAIHETLPEAARRQPRGLVMDPHNARHLRLALAGNAQSGGGVWETRDGGKTWTRLSGNAPLSDIQSLQADPFDFDTLYLGQRESYDRSLNPPVLWPGGLFKSTDGGKTWTRVFDYHFVASVTLDPARRGVVYAGTNDHPYHDGNRATGVWKSTDSGATWTSVSAGMTHSNITCLNVGAGRLWAGTAGNGVFVAPVE